jgi:large subunit ribosomal protein L18
MSTTRNVARVRRHHRVRKKVSGTAARPRLAVYRSNRHVYAQLIDDDTGRTLVAASTKESEAGVTKNADVDAAKGVGRRVAERAKAAGVESVVFDRAGYRYHGQVAAVADAAREAGLRL